MTEKINKIFKALLEWVVYIIIFAAIVWGTPKLLVILFHTDYPIASITSGSMWPALKQNDIVFIRGYTGNNDDLKVGDIVVYRNERGFTIHRIIELNDTNLITRGDANNITDPPIKYDQLIGKMITWRNQPLRIPWLGRFSQIIQTNS